MECVRKTQDVTKAMSEKNWELAVSLRGRSFKVSKMAATFKARSDQLQSAANLQWASPSQCPH